jgi:hypothetical protein
VAGEPEGLFLLQQSGFGYKALHDLLQLFTLCCATSAVEFLQAVQSQLQSEQVLGWFAYRPVTSLQPTTQECMISSSMAAAALGSLQVNQDNPQTLFAVISCLPRHEGSSCNIQQCMFQLDSSRYALLCLARGPSISFLLLPSIILYDCSSSLTTLAWA